MKVAYIAHPISGDVPQNLKMIEFIARHINLTEPNIIPFAPYYLDCHALHDYIPEERARGIRNNIALFHKGFLDELRLYGPTISSGMAHEIELAHKLGIKVIPMSDATKKQYIK